LKYSCPGKNSSGQTRARLFFVIESFQKSGLIPPIKDKYSPSYRLGKLLYRRRAPWEQRRKGMQLLVTAGLSIFLGVAFGFLILHFYRKG
jgi:hypothetical protein